MYFLVVCLQFAYPGALSAAPVAAAAACAAPLANAGTASKRLHKLQAFTVVFTTAKVLANLNAPVALAAAPVSAVQHNELWQLGSLPRDW